ncbi:MAG: FhaA domain-containing protein [Acidimicrobiales bacterium]
MSKVIAVGFEGFERRVETIVESMFSRATRRGIEPVEIGRRIVRDAERNKKVAHTGILLPNLFRVHLSPADYREMVPILSAIHHELLELVKETAQEGKYRFVGAVSVDFLEDRSQRPGSLFVESAFREDESSQVRPFVVLPGGRRVALGDGEFLIGRSPSCSLVIEDARVSRNHAIISTRDGAVAIRDLNSTNGTFVNGERVSREVVLHNGDDIKIGASQVTFVIE